MTVTPKTTSPQLTSIGQPTSKVGLESRNSDSTIFPNSETLSTAFKGYSGILQVEASTTTNAELYLIQTLTTGCVYNYETFKDDLVKKLQDYSVSAFNAIESDQYPPADIELLKINIGKLNLIEKRALGLRILNNDYDQYLAVYRQRLKLNAYELFLYKISDKLTEGNDEGKESRIKNFTLDLFGEVPLQKTKTKITDARKATIASTKELLDMMKESPDLLSLLSNNCSRLNIDIYNKSKISAENVAKVLEFLEKEGLERFRSCVQYIQYLKMIELFHRDPSKVTTDPNNINPTLIVNYLDELTRTFDDTNERLFSPKYGKQIERTLIDLLRETLDTFDKAYEAEVREIDAIRVTSLSSTAQAVNGRASLETTNRLVEQQAPILTTTDQSSSATPIPESNGLPLFEIDSPSVIASRKNGSHKKGKTTKPLNQADFNNRRLLSLGLATAGGITALGLGAWTLGFFGNGKPEQNNTTSNGNGGTPKVNPGTETKTASETEKKKAELVAEIVKLKAEFSTYTEAEDKKQVSDVYLNHGLNVTMASETQLKGLTEEALRDIYVESLDASCRVQAKKELEELEKQYPISGITGNQLNENIRNVYLKVPFIYLLTDPSEELIRKDLSKNISIFEQVTPTYAQSLQEQSKNFIVDLKLFLNNEINKEELLNRLQKYHGVFNHPSQALRCIYSIRLIREQNIVDKVGIPEDLIKDSVNTTLRKCLSEKEYYLGDERIGTVEAMLGWTDFSETKITGFSEVILSITKGDNGEYLNPTYSLPSNQERVKLSYENLLNKLNRCRKELINSIKKDMSVNRKDLLGFHRCIIRISKLSLLVNNKFDQINNAKKD